MSVNNYTPKQIALMKQEFMQSDFGKYAAEKINGMYGDHHSKAENINNTASKTAAHINRAAGINEVIKFFADDVRLLGSGYFNDDKEENTKA